MTHSFPTRRSSDLDLLTSRPGVLGGLPLLEKGVLRSDLPFERARMAPQRNARQCGVRQNVGEQIEIGRPVLEAARCVAHRHIGDAPCRHPGGDHLLRSEEHTSELQSLMSISYAVFCLKKKPNKYTVPHHHSNLH